MERALTFALAVALVARAPRVQADEPVAAAPTVEASPCVAELLDVERLIDALRIERATPGVADDRPIRLDCAGSALAVRVGDGAPIGVTLDDVARADRPRVVALALAEHADPPSAPGSTGVETATSAEPAARPSASPPRPAPPRGARVARSVRSAGLEPWSGWSLGASVEALGIPSASAGGFLVGPRLVASLWGRAVGAHLGAGALAGSGGGSAVRLAVVNARFALAGPAVASGRLDVELGLEGGASWSHVEEVDTTDQRLVAILSADIVLRLPFSRGSSWGIAFDLGYRRAYGGEVADLIAAGVGLVRALDAPNR